MCIGQGEPGGPKRCAGDALIACQRAQRAVDGASQQVLLLERQDDDLAREMEIITAMQQALDGELSPEREAELIARADKYRRETLSTDSHSSIAEPDTREAWDRRVATVDANVAGDRARWEDEAQRLAAYQQEGHSEAIAADEMRERMRAEYESFCDAVDECPSEEGLTRYVDTELAATASAREHAADVVEGYYLKQWRDEAIECHRGRARHMDQDAALAEVDNRAHSEELTTLIAARDTARLELEDATEQWNRRREELAAAADNDPYKACTDPAVLANLDAARDRINQASAEYLLAKQDLEHYQDCTAQYAGRAGELYTAQMKPIDSRQLGAASYVGTYPEGTRDWLEVRQNGFGGSDISTALGYDAYDSPKTVVDSKVRPITDDEVAEQQRGVTEYVGAAPRGHAWEPVNAKRFADEHPNLRLRHTKATWEGDEPWQRLHLDNVIVDENEHPIAPWESKTASDVRQWDNGIPVGYRAQLGHAMDTLGTDRAAITVTFDGRETRTYWMGRNEPIDPNDPLQRTYADRKPELRALWSKVEQAKREAAKPKPPPKRNNGTFKWVANPGTQSSRDTNASTARQLAVYRGCSIAEAESMIQQRIAAGDKADAAVRHCYDTYHPRRDPHRRFVVLDFETNGTHAGKHEVIQTGYQVIDGRGTLYEESNSYHGINPHSAPTVGVGMKDVHRIDYQRIHGRPRFAQSEQRARLRELADDPNVTFVAHSANFERSFLQANAIPTSRVIDTMNLSRKFDHHSTGATLKDFTAARGIDYADDAHDALVDAKMTSRALLRFWNRETGV